MIRSAAMDPGGIERVLINGPRMQPRLAVYKPILGAIEADASCSRCEFG